MGHWMSTSVVHRYRRAYVYLMARRALYSGRSRRSVFLGRTEPEKGEQHGR